MDIYKKGDFGMNLELHENLLFFCYCFRGTVGLAMVLTYFDMFYHSQIFGFVRVQSIS